MYCKYCKQPHPDHFIFCPITGHRIVWDNKSINEEREIQRYQKDLRTHVPLGGMYHKLRFKTERQKESERQAVIYAFENKEQISEIIRRSKSYDHIVENIINYLDFNRESAEAIADRKFIILDLV